MSFGWSLVEQLKENDLFVINCGGLVVRFAKAKRLVDSRGRVHNSVQCWRLDGSFITTPVHGDCVLRYYPPDQRIPKADQKPPYLTTARLLKVGQFVSVPQVGSDWSDPVQGEVAALKSEERGVPGSGYSLNMAHIQFTDGQKISVSSFQLVEVCIKPTPIRGHLHTEMWF